MLIYCCGNSTWSAVVKASIKDLCCSLPKALSAYFKHLDSLGSEDKPNYDCLRQIFINLYESERFRHDVMFDWMIRKFQSKGNNTATVTDMPWDNTGEPFVKQPDYDPTTQEDLQKIVQEIRNM